MYRHIDPYNRTSAMIARFDARYNHNRNHNTALAYAYMYSDGTVYGRNVRYNAIKRRAMIRQRAQHVYTGHGYRSNIGRYGTMRLFRRMQPMITFMAIRYQIPELRAVQSQRQRARYYRIAVHWYTIDSTWQRVMRPR